MLDHPIHPGRANLQRRLRHETLQQSFEHLGDNDNLATLMPLMSGRPFSPGNYQSDVMIVTKMTRVRKLLADARRDPQATATFLQQQIRSLAAEYPQQYEQYMQMRKENPGTLRSRELHEHLKTRIKATAAVFVLSQIDEPGALETLAWLSGQGERGRKYSGAVNRKFLLYAMHSLISRQQEDVADSGRNEYLQQAAKWDVLQADTVSVAAWDAHYHEGDFRVRLPDSRIDLDAQPQIRLQQFPLLERLGSGKVEMLLKSIGELVAPMG